MITDLPAAAILSNDDLAVGVSSDLLTNLAWIWGKESA